MATQSSDHSPIYGLWTIKKLRNAGDVKTNLGEALTQIIRQIEKATKLSVNDNFTAFTQAFNTETGSRISAVGFRRLCENIGVVKPTVSTKKAAAAKAAPKRRAQTRRPGKTRTSTATAAETPATPSAE